ncbi:MAG TPA: transglycosylase SLT domain-containing protein [Rhodopila sp.]|nr:transglycosylase SLT domain-containing protein [Rhodopila sp.]
MDGTARLFDTARDAAQWTQTVSSGNRHSIDVGCFQISLLYHPDAFATLDQAFDPATNADYAARFLASLKDRLGSWPAAVAAYHSADPERGLAYRQRVFAAWSGRARIQDVVAPSETVIPGVHVWTPSPAGFAMAIITLGRPASSALPHIVTPAR